MKRILSNKLQANLVTKWLLISAALLVLGACTTSDSVEAPSGEPDTHVKDILYSSGLDLGAANVLDGAVLSGKVQLFMANTQALSKVEFYIDKEEVSVEAEPYSAITYNGLETSRAADYIDTTIFEDGVHVLSATIEGVDGSVREVNATFLIQNNSSLADQLLVSSNASRSGATVLGSKELSGNAHIFVIPRERVKQIAFYLNDPQRSRRPRQVERIVQYDFAGTASGGKARSFDTRRLSDGRHTVTALLTMVSGGTKVISKTFVVNNSSPAPQPTPQPAPTSGGFPVSLFGRVPEASNVTMNVSKPSNASKATIVLNTYGADVWREGELYVNGNGPLRLFGRQASSAFYRSTKQMSFNTPASWWRNGNNVVQFRHIYHEGFRINSAEVRFDNATSPAPSPSPSPAPSPEPSPAPTPPAPQPRSTYSLRGNPNFSISSLNAEQRKWYLKLWEAIDNPKQHPNALWLAKSDDVYLYRGDLHYYVNSLLMAFRFTGDLRLLDQVDRVAQLMRAELEDSWRGTRDGTNGRRDGFLNWVDRHDTVAKYAGKDTQRAFDMKAHTLVAMIAWTLHNNRDLRSPSGINYGSHADFWKNYLTNHFEAKWRKREGKASGFPFIIHYELHTYHSWMRWHHYMGKLTGKSAYTREAERMANTLWSKEFKETSSKYGTAIVWHRGVVSKIAQSQLHLSNFLAPQHYARYVIGEAVDLHFEGFHKYAQDSTMRKFANSVAAFMITDSGFSRDIGGGRSRAGIAASPTSWSNMNNSRFAESSWSLISAWDKNSGNRISKRANDVNYVVENVKYGVKQKRVFIPTGLFVREMLK